MQAQLDGQRVAARAELAPVHESSWWDQAQVRDAARAYETAVTFRDIDQAARDAASRIRQELCDRCRVEVLETGADTRRGARHTRRPRLRASRAPAAGP
jgi:hypothetical protein